MNPGPWTLVIDGVDVAPRRIFVGERDSQTDITGSEIDDGQLMLTGDGFGAGSQAWALWGSDRAPVPLTRLNESSTELIFEINVLPKATLVDLLVLSNGRQLAVVDVLGDPVVDTGEPIDTGTPTTDTAQPEEDASWTANNSANKSQTTGCGCTHTPAAGGTLWFVLIGGAIGWRRV
jgi:hypothetical protein